MKQYRNQYGSWRRCEERETRICYTDKKTNKCTYYVLFEDTPPRCEAVCISDHVVAFSEKIGTVILDNECKRSAAGTRLHSMMRKHPCEHGLQPIRVQGVETCRPGDDPAVTSEHAWLYPVGLYGQHAQLDSAEVPCECSPLLSLQAMADLGVVLGFSQNTITIAAVRVEDEPMPRARGGHSALDIVSFGADHHEWRKNSGAT